jgi:hypothetical protein
VADGVFDDVADNQKAQEHTHTGEHQERPPAAGNKTGQAVLNGMNGPFEAHGGKAAENAGYNGKKSDGA